MNSTHSFSKEFEFIKLAQAQPKQLTEKELQNLASDQKDDALSYNSLKELEQEEELEE